MGSQGSSRGSAVVSVTSEALANLSFQGAPARSGRPDSERSAGSDNFATLVGSNTAASSDNRAPEPAPRRTEDSQSPPDSRARDNAASDKAASDKAATDKGARSDARTDPSDRDAAVAARDTADANGKA